MKRECTMTYVMAGVGIFAVGVELWRHAIEFLPFWVPVAYGLGFWFGTKEPAK